MGYALERHKTDGYKSLHSTSPALMKRETMKPHSHTHFVQFLHPAPAEGLFKDSLWVTFFPPLSVWEAQNGCFKYSGVACERTFFLYWGTLQSMLEMIAEFITFITSG